MNRSSVRIAIQKSGRLRKDSENLLRTWGIAGRSRNNKLVVPSSDGKFEILLVRNSDIPKYIENGAADFGIVGENILYEETFSVKVVKRLGFGYCRLVIAVPAGSTIQKPKDLEGERIATSYPNSLRKFLRKEGVSATIVRISGGVEAAPALNLADAICDITQTGNTLSDNGLKAIRQVMSSEAVLIEGLSAGRANIAFKRKYLGG